MSDTDDFLNKEEGSGRGNFPDIPLEEIEGEEEDSEAEAEAEAEETEISYVEIMATLALNNEVIITIPSETESIVKIGLKNFRAKQRIQLKSQGIPFPEEALEFTSYPSEDYDDCIDLHISLRKKGVVIIKKMIIPDNEF